MKKKILFTICLLGLTLTIGYAVNAATKLLGRYENVTITHDFNKTYGAYKSENANYKAGFNVNSVSAGENGYTLTNVTLQKKSFLFWKDVGNGNIKFSNPNSGSINFAGVESGEVRFKVAGKQGTLYTTLIFESY